MALDDQVGWAQHLLDYHGRGDFSLIGRACVFSADAWVRLCAVQGKRRIAPLRAGQRFDTRAALCAHGATAAALDDAFWRLADRGYARFLEAFDWVLAYRQHMPEWTQTMAVAKTVQSVLKTHGLSRTIPAAVRA
jgi:hypothetical protein